MIKFNAPCPHCRHMLEFQDDWCGMTVSCPVCGQKFVVPAAPPPELPPIAPVAPPELPPAVETASRRQWRLTRLAVFSSLFFGMVALWSKLLWLWGNSVLQSIWHEHASRGGSMEPGIMRCHTVRFEFEIGFLIFYLLLAAVGTAVAHRARVLKEATVVAFVLSALSRVINWVISGLWAGFAAAHDYRATIWSAMPRLPRILDFVGTGVLWLVAIFLLWRLVFRQRCEGRWFRVLCWISAWGAISLFTSFVVERGLVVCFFGMRNFVTNRSAIYWSNFICTTVPMIVAVLLVFLLGRRRMKSGCVLASFSAFAMQCIALLLPKLHYIKTGKIFRCVLLFPWFWFEAKSGQDFIIRYFWVIQWGVQVLVGALVFFGVLRFCRKGLREIDGAEDPDPGTGA